jgi:CHAT domain
MRFVFPSILLFLSISFAAAQDPAKTRTRVVDYARYDQLTTALGYAPDKPKAIKDLLAFSNANFSPVDEEYFNVRVLASTYESQLFNNQHALELLREAVDAFEKNFPFFNRGYATVTRDNLAQAYLSVARYDIALNLFDKAIQFLDSKRSELENNKGFSVTPQFYSLYAQALLGDEQYDSAISVSLKMQKQTEAGAFAFPSQNPDSIYKINPSWTPELKKTMETAKEQYIKTMRESQAAILSNQRMDYNRILSDALYRQYQYAKAVPYMKAMADEMIRMMDYSKKAMLTSQEQLKNVTLADSVRQQMNDAAAFIDRLNEMGVSSALLIIAACKSGQPDLAASYAFGKLEKALLYQLKLQPEEAERQYQLAFDLMKKMSSTRWFSAAGDQFYRAYRPFYIDLLVQEGNLTKAYSEMLAGLVQEEESLKKSFQYLTESERKEFFTAYNKKLERYYSLLLLMTEKNDDRSAEILNKILQTKGIILDITLSQEKQLKKIKDKAVLEQIQTMRKLRDKLAGFYQLNLRTPSPSISDSISTISVRINTLERKINEKLGVATEVLKPVDWKSIQAKLKNGEVYIEIFRVKRDNFLFDKPLVQYWAFAIKKGEAQPTLFKLSEGEAFESRDFKNYQNRIRSELDDNESFKTYWASIGEITQGASRIILSEDGVYHMINPLTLINPASGNYLLTDISLTRVSTGRDFLKSSDVATATHDISLIGNPAFSMSRKENVNLYQGKEFDRMESDRSVTRDGMALLPGTEKEVKSIGSMATIKGVKTNVFSGAQATEANVKALKNQQVVHLATHGAFDRSSRADSYLRARLILAGAADPEPFTIQDYGMYEDGFLTAYEVTQLDFSQTNLVVLSACETGEGEVQSGEGVWGLQRAFQLAGARTVMGSLWKISDAATVVFMTAFYQKYLSTSDIDAAYKSAMLETMKQYPKPYYWGAFTLTGVQ